MQQYKSSLVLDTCQLKLIVTRAGAAAFPLARTGPRIRPPAAELLGVQEGDGARLHGDAPLLLLFPGETGKSRVCGVVVSFGQK